MGKIAHSNFTPDICTSCCEQGGGRMARTAGMLALFTLFSRLLGLVRDMGMAWLVGCGPVADALVADLRLPHLLRRLLGEGSLSMTLTRYSTASLSDTT